jgi:hypothetical protein
VVPPSLGRTLAFVFASGQARRVISVREGRIEKHFTGSQAKGKSLGSKSGNGSTIAAFTPCPVLNTAARRLRIPLQGPGNQPTKSTSKFMRRPKTGGGVAAQFRVGPGFENAE